MTPISKQHIIGQRWIIVDDRKRLENKSKSKIPESPWNVDWPFVGSEQITDPGSLCGVNSTHCLLGIVCRKACRSLLSTLLEPSKDVSPFPTTWTYSSSVHKYAPQSVGSATGWIIGFDGMGNGNRNKAKAKKSENFYKYFEKLFKHFIFYWVWIIVSANQHRWRLFH